MSHQETTSKKYALLHLVSPLVWAIALNFFFAQPLIVLMLIPLPYIIFVAEQKWGDKQSYNHIPGIVNHQITLILIAPIVIFFILMFVLGTASPETDAKVAILSEYFVFGIMILLGLYIFVPPIIGAIFALRGSIWRYPAISLLQNTQTKEKIVKKNMSRAWLNHAALIPLLLVPMGWVVAVVMLVLGERKYENLTQRNLIRSALDFVITLQVIQMLFISVVGFLMALFAIENMMFHTIITILLKIFSVICPLIGSYRSWKGNGWIYPAFPFNLLFKRNEYRGLRR
ncbi:MAG: hypothetical protein ACRCWQ_04760 [Bacilli bacterium]